MGQLIDSSVFIALERRGLSLRELRIADDQPVALAAVTASELISGIYRADTPERRTRREAFVERILATIPVLAFDLPVARLHALLENDLRARGLRIGAHDTMIAATALAYGYDLLTDNVRHFERVAALSVRRPVE